MNLKDALPLFLLKQAEFAQLKKENKPIFIRYNSIEW
jgi:hypothetical protein